MLKTFLNWCFILLVCVEAYDLNFFKQYLPIFEPFPVNSINPIQLCKNASTDVMNVFESNQKKLIALSLKQCGFGIYDITSLENGISLLKHFEYSLVKGNVQSLDSTDSEQYLWVGYETGLLEIYGVSNLFFSLKASFQIEYQGQLDIVYKITQFDGFSFIFLSCKNNLKVVTWFNNQLNITKVIGLNDLRISKIILQPYQNMLFVQGQSSIHIFKQTINELLQGQLQYLCSYQPDSNSIISSFEVMKQTILIIQIQLQEYIMVDIKNFIASYDGNKCAQSKIQQINKYPALSHGSQLILSNDQNFLFAQLSSVGIYIFDVSQNQFTVFQSIQINGFCSYFQISNDQKQLFYSNKYQTQIFQLAIPNLNLDVPNLLANQYYLYSYSLQQMNNYNIKQNRFIYQEKESILFQSLKDYGIEIFEYQGSGVIRLQSTFQNQYLGYLERVPGTTIFYLIQEQQGIQILDFKNISYPQILNNNLTLSQSYVQFQKIAFNSQATLGFIANLQYLLIINILNKQNPFLLSAIDTSMYLSGNYNLEQFTLSNDEDLLFLLPKQFGILIANISNVFNPYIAFKLVLQNINTVVQTQDNYLIFGMEFQGIQVYFLNSNTTLTFISQIFIEGVINTAQLIYNDNYLLVTETSSIILVSLKDRIHPFILQKIELNNYERTSSITTYQDGQFAFLSTYSNIYQLFLQSPIFIHQQIYKMIQIPNSLQYKRVNIINNQPFQVGDQIEIYLINIHQKYELKIQSAFYYQNFIQSKLPDWMNFKFQDQVLQMTISKDSLAKDVNGNYSLNSLQQVIFLGYQQLQDDAFINLNLSINSEDSLFLKQICTSLGYLDKQGFVSTSYSSKNVFTLREYQYAKQFSKWNQTQIQLQQLLTFVQFILNQNVVNYAIQFYTQPSLIVDFDNTQNIIQSNQNLITVTLHTSIGQFVSKKYTGIIEIINQQQDTIKLQGSVLSLNQALKLKIKLFIQNAKLLEQTQITVTIDDFINYQYIKKFPLSKVNFVSLETLVSLSQRIQDDLDKYYGNGEIYLLTPFNYQISNSIFQYDKEQNILYSAQIQVSDGSFEDIPVNFWLQFSSGDKSFKGTPPTQIFNSEYMILVQVTDGYSTVEDKFKIKEVYQDQKVFGSAE
ncbi:hypothetical protein ABPG74_017923 [Tetrahymena malaccensis]